ncbi:hypothetical protein KSP39_PZI008030 [Platanthera zijinensis]|uniref:Uncharacterized protein n=1 Tax=Platanthera zijinensis TaxID=2320716 RepID=A0AAP0BQ63_9ASPA
MGGGLAAARRTGHQCRQPFPLVVERPVQERAAPSRGEAVRPSSFGGLFHRPA